MSKLLNYAMKNLSKNFCHNQWLCFSLMCLIRLIVSSTKSTRLNIDEMADLHSSPLKRYHFLVVCGVGRHLKSLCNAHKIRKINQQLIMVPSLTIPAPLPTHTLSYYVKVAIGSESYLKLPCFKRTF